LIKLFTGTLVALTISHYNGFFKLVEALLQIHSCFFSHNMKQRVLRRSQDSSKRAPIWSPNPKSQARTWPEPDIGVRSPIQARKLNLPSESRYAQVRSIKKRSIRA